jgi:MarR family transcriptional regulator for hemolysin
MRAVSLAETIDIESFDIYAFLMSTREEPIGLYVTRSARTLSRAFDASLAERGGSLATWAVLASLAADESHRSQRSIATAVGIEGPTLTHHLHRMETAGLVRRTRDPEDRRAQSVALTPEGRDAFAGMLDVVRDFDHRLRADLSDTEVGTLRSLLARLVANVGEPMPEGSPT